MINTNIVRYSLYTLSRIVRRNPTVSGSYLPLYQSKVFNNNPDLNDQLSNPQAAKRYKQILPSLIFSETGTHSQKFLTISLQFDPETQRIKIVTLRQNGIVEQEFHIKNIIPWTYADMIASSKSPEPLMPVFIDDTMLYYNSFLNETLLFEEDGEWDEKTVEHEKLQLDKLLDEKNWFDRRNLI